MRVQELVVQQVAQQVVQQVARPLEQPVVQPVGELVDLLAVLQVVAELQQPLAQLPLAQLQHQALRLALSPLVPYPGQETPHMTLP